MMTSEGRRSRQNELVTRRSDDRRQSLLDKLETQKLEVAYHPVSTCESDEEGESATQASFGKRLIDNHCFQNVMALVIVGNGVAIGLETDNKEWSNWTTINNVFLGIFTIELTLKIAVEGRQFSNPMHQDFLWNLFDLTVVGLGLFDSVGEQLCGVAGPGGFVTIMRMVRLMRILRLFRLLKFLKKLYLLATGLVEACKAIFWVTILMSFVLYICAIVLVKTIGRPPTADPHYEFLNEHFGDIVTSMITLFTMMSSPNLPIYQEQDDLLDSHPMLTVFLVVFITFGSFGMIAMLTGVINESMFENNEMRKADKRLEHEATRKALAKNSSALYEDLPLDHRGYAKVSDLRHVAPAAGELLDQIGVNIAQGDILRFLELMDADESGFIDMKQFVHAMEKIAEGNSALAIVALQHYVSLTDRKISVTLHRLESIELSIQQQMEHTTEEIDRIHNVICPDIPPEQTRPNPSATESRNMDQFRSYLLPMQTLSDELKQVESRLLSSMGKGSDGSCDKSLDNLELLLSNIVSRQCETIFNSLETLLDQKNVNSCQQPVWAKADRVQELPIESLRSTRLEANSESNSLSSSLKPTLLEQRFDLFEEKLLRSIAELGGVILDGVADLSSRSRSPAKQEHTPQSPLAHSGRVMLGPP